MIGRRKRIVAVQGTGLGRPGAGWKAKTGEGSSGYSAQL